PAMDVSRDQSNYYKALTLATHGHPERPLVRTRWADDMRQGGGHAQADRALKEAVASFKEQGNTILAARAMTVLANVFGFMGDPVCRSVAAQAVHLLEPEPPSLDLLDAYTERAHREESAGNYGEAIRCADRALGLASELGLKTP